MCVYIFDIYHAQFCITNLLELQIRKLNLPPEKCRKRNMKTVSSRARATFVNFIYGHVAFLFCFRFFLMAANKQHNKINNNNNESLVEPPPSGVKGHLSAEKCG